jgi:hypothetical protein
MASGAAVGVCRPGQHDPVMLTGSISITARRQHPRHAFTWRVESHYILTAEHGVSSASASPL